MVEFSPEIELTVLYRIEPGCLGPDGKDHIEELCIFATKVFSTIDSGCIHWDLVPRHDKSLPEIQYKVSDKNLSQDQARQYLSLLDKDIEAFESLIDENLAEAIDDFFQR